MVWQRTAELGAGALFIAINLVLLAGVVNMVGDFGAGFRIAPQMQAQGSIPVVVISAGKARAVAALDTRDCQRPAVSRGSET
jgi:hypothetical protein